VRLANAQYLGRILAAGAGSNPRGSAARLRDRVLERVLDVFLCGAAGRRLTPRYLERIVRALDPKLIVPTHYDDFFRPLGAPTEMSFNVNLTGFADELHAVARDVPVRTLEVGVLVRS